jgi:hypothetical protein
MGSNQDFFIFGGKNSPLGNEKKKGCDLYKCFFEKKNPPKVSMFCRKTS